MNVNEPLCPECGEPTREADYGVMACVPCDYTVDLFPPEPEPESRRKDQTMKTAIALTAALALTGCAGLDAQHQPELEMMRRAGVDEIHAKTPWLAATLNILPGGGDLYTGSYGAFALDFLAWPYSILWSIPQGAITAGQMRE